jgi:hypothetical protein
MNKKNFGRLLSAALHATLRRLPASRLHDVPIEAYRFPWF